MHFGPDYREEATLRDGRTIVLRLVRPDDKALFMRGLEQMSPESRYLRFFAPKNHLTKSELHYLTEVDQQHHFAMGAVVEGDDGDEGVAVARFVELDEPHIAEPAIAVVDALQGNGLGRLLFVRLIAAAAERGITHFRCEVLAENVAMRELIHKLAPDAIEHSDGANLVVLLPIPNVESATPPESEAARGAAYRLFAMVAEQLITIRRELAGRLL